MNRKSKPSEHEGKRLNKKVAVFKDYKHISSINKYYNEKIKENKLYDELKKINNGIIQSKQELFNNSIYLNNASISSWVNDKYNIRKPLHLSDGVIDDYISVNDLWNYSI